MIKNKDFYQLLKKNQRTSDGFQYTVPAHGAYPYQWLWDSCFHVIILAHFKVSEAKQEILSLLSKQFENGMIPHMIYWNTVIRGTFPRISWGKNKTSSITQPPMLAYAVWQIFQKDQDNSFIRKVYTHLYHFYKYLLTERDPHADHLIGIMNPDESGEDNSPRFDLALNLPPNHSLKENTKKRMHLVKQNIECHFDAPFCMRNFFWVKDVPFNVIMVENLRLLVQLATSLGYSEDAKFFDEQKEKIILAMRKFMVDDGLFWSTFGEDYQKIKIKTWAIFAPLFAKILSQKEAKDLVEKHLLNPKEFWTNFPVPTTSLDEPSFDPSGFWRGPTWIGINWFIYKGLLNYGFNDIAKKIKQSSINLLEKSGFREYFNPQTGEGFGARQFSWCGLVADMD